MSGSRSARTPGNQSGRARAKPNGAAGEVLPANLDAERFVLGSILLDDKRFAGDAAASLVPTDFILEGHRRIFHRMCDLYNREERIDLVTVCDELMRHSELDSVGGLSYLTSLDDGLPHLSNIDSYIGVLKEKNTLRQVQAMCQNLTTRVALGEKPAEILEAANNLLAGFAASGKAMRVADVNCASSAHSGTARRGPIRICWAGTRAGVESPRPQNGHGTAKTSSGVLQWHARKCSWSPHFARLQVWGSSASSVTKMSFDRGRTRRNVRLKSSVLGRWATFTKPEFRS